MSFLPAERFIITLIATLAGLDICLILWKGVGVDIAGYAALVSCGIFVIALGQYYRHFRRDAGIAMAATAAGLFIIFTMAGSIFNYMLLPIRSAPIDPWLVWIDAHLGYDWQTFVIWASQYPAVGTILRIVYITSLPQLVAVILILGLSRRQHDLHRFLMTGIIGAILAILCWSFFPSFGASSIYQLPQSVLDAVPIAVGPDYGAELRRLGQDGVDYLTPANVLGLIGFPSFHTVMACMSAIFLGRVRMVAIPAILLNAAMVPAILIQGGHNLMDMIGGIVTFAIAYVLAGAALAQCKRGYAKRRHRSTTPATA